MPVDDHDLGVRPPAVRGSTLGWQHRTTPSSTQQESANWSRAEVEVFQLAAMSRQSDFEPLANPDGDGRSGLVQDVSGIGNELAELLRDPTIEEIRGNDGDLTYRTHRWPGAPVGQPGQQEAVLCVCQRLLSKADEQLDAAHPRADAVRIYVATPYGERQARLSASVPPRVDGVISFTLRIPQKRNTTLHDLVGFGSITEPAATFLEVVVQGQPLQDTRHRPARGRQDHPYRGTAARLAGAGPRHRVRGEP